MMIPPAARFFVQLAGVSGAAAVILGAYGAHAFKPSTPEAREVFETGNRYHLIHSVALGLAPFSRHPKVTGLLFTLGMLGFCGSCYGYSLAQSQTLRQMAPYGGICLILAWLSLIF
ncbi:transmembrane protein 256 homolog [Paramacrobiotus metropolitanus]|uniref:transmembrane protein 256 homolog n=1 Tax=Paramacrobiotus metropolitanus TaxID=2943436 RepID=UPI00244605EF|nr:transmembrane protein 256 homolog [Paramacrobiotus metropolitanus]